MTKSSGTNTPRLTGVGKRAGILGPATKVQNTSEKTNTRNQRGKAKDQTTGGKLSPNSTSGNNAKRFGQGKPTDNRSGAKSQ